MRIHIIQEDETLTTVAAQYEVDEEAVIKSNPQLANPELIVSGMKLKIPQPYQKIIHKKNKNVNISEKGTRNRQEKRRKSTQEQEMKHKTRRPINEPLDDDGRRVGDYHVGIRMFHPSARPFSSLKHKQVIHSKPSISKGNHHLSKKQDSAKQNKVENKHIFCDCCQRPIYFD